MLTFKNETDEFKIYFKHQKRTDKKGHKHPKSTHCFISHHDKIISEGRAKPVNKLPFNLNINDNPEKIFGNKLIEVLRYNDKTRVAIVRGDTFNYHDGRIESAKKALNNLSEVNDTLKNEVLCAL